MPHPPSPSLLRLMCTLHFWWLQVISGSADMTLRVWDLTDGTCIRTLTGHRGGVCCVAVVSEDWVISGSADNTLRVWRRAGWSGYIRTLSGHRRSVCAVAVVNRQYVVSASADATLRLWDLYNGHCIGLLADKPPHLIVRAVVVYRDPGDAGGKPQVCVAWWQGMGKELLGWGGRVAFFLVEGAGVGGWKTGGSEC